MRGCYANTSSTPPQTGVLYCKIKKIWQLFKQFHSISDKNVKYKNNDIVFKVFKLIKSVDPQ
jgi:hypothetical protein